MRSQIDFARKLDVSDCLDFLDTLYVFLLLQIAYKIYPRFFSNMTNNLGGQQLNLHYSEF